MDINFQKKTEMAHINIDETLPGIRGLMDFSPATARPMNELAELLLRAENTLSRGDRELVATYVSYLNDCFFCQNAHGGIAQHYLECDMEFIDGIKEDYSKKAISDKLKALLAIAGSVCKEGKYVTEDQLDRARSL